MVTKLTRIEGFPFSDLIKESQLHFIYLIFKCDLRILLDLFAVKNRSDSERSGPLRADLEYNDLSTINVK